MYVLAWSNQPITHDAFFLQFTQKNRDMHLLRSKSQMLHEAKHRLMCKAMHIAKIQSELVIYLNVPPYFLDSACILCYVISKLEASYCTFSNVVFTTVDDASRFITHQQFMISMPRGQRSTCAVTPVVREHLVLKTHIGHTGKEILMQMEEHRVVALWIFTCFSLTPKDAMQPKAFWPCVVRWSLLILSCK